MYNENGVQALSLIHIWDGYFRFRKDGEELSMIVSEIREKAGAKSDESLHDQSKGRVSALFDKERANDPKYVAELENDGISIKRWENLKGHDLSLIHISFRK